MPSSPRCARWRSRASWRRRWTSTRSSRSSRVYAPNEYAVWLSPDDRKQFEGYEDELARELSRLPARARAARADRARARSPQIEFKTDERLRLGEFGIQARLVRPPAQEHEPPSQGDEGHTMVYSTLERVQEPLREPDPRRGRARLRVGRPRRGRRLRAARCWAARATATSCSTTRTSRATTRRCARPAAPGSSTTSARPTASRSTAAASKGPQSLKRGDVIELGTSRVTFELE